jgi:hypothetical protein
LRLIARGRCLSKVSLLGAILALASTNLGKLFDREVSINNSSRGISTRGLVSSCSKCNLNNNSSKGISTRGLVSIGNKSNLNSNSSNTGTTRHLARWCKLNSRTRIIQLRGLVTLDLVLNATKWDISPIGAQTRRTNRTNRSSRLDMEGSIMLLPRKLRTLQVWCLVCSPSIPILL